jgi:hypothetical protein
MHWQLPMHNADTRPLASAVDVCLQHMFSPMCGRSAVGISLCARTQPGCGSWGVIPASRLDLSARQLRFPTVPVGRRRGAPRPGRFLVPRRARVVYLGSVHTRGNPRLPDLA